jgi:hypothetical protein
MSWRPIYAARQVATRSIWLAFCSGGKNSSGMEEKKEANRYNGNLQYYVIWWEGKIVLKKVGRKFWQKP